jgi:uncharacterized protein (TIGR02145 family)
MKISPFIVVVLMLNSISVFSQTVTDIDGNFYTTVSIGNQVWMGENLKTTAFNNQEPIPLVLDDAQWSTQTQPAYCYYQGDLTNVSDYGNLYNWYLVNDSRNVCPTGYHVPALSEWEELINFLGGNAVAGGKLKEIGLAHWLDPNTAADNASGFTALPSGWRANNNGAYENLSYMGYVWSSTAVDALNSSIILVGYDSPASYTSDSHIRTGLPIRCLKDASASLNESSFSVTHSEITLFPNAVCDYLNASISLELVGTEYCITDFQGKNVFSGKLTSMHSLIDLTSLTSGIYLFKVENKVYRITKE